MAGRQLYCRVCSIALAYRPEDRLCGHCRAEAAGMECARPCGICHDLRDDASPIPAPTSVRS